MTAATLLSIAYWFLRLANGVFNAIDREQLMKLGEDRQSAKQMAVLNENAKMLNEIDERFDKMTDQDVQDEIAKQGDWRD